MRLGLTPRTGLTPHTTADNHIPEANLCEAPSSKQLVSFAVAVAVAVGFDVGVAVNVAACMPKHLHFIHESSALL